MPRGGRREARNGASDDETRGDEGTGSHQD
jgi:hypothetical protein